MSRMVVEFHSSKLMRKTEVVIYIPSMNLIQGLQCKKQNPYQEDTKKFPLMILLPGFAAGKYDWEIHSEVEDLAEQYQMALVMLGGENKWYLNYSQTDLWADFINIELPDFIYGQFNKIDSKLPRYIAGVSMGGYGALYNYLSNMDLYKACCSLSPATRADNDLEKTLGIPSLKDLFIQTADQKKNIYLSIGTKDFVYEVSKEFDAFLKENNTGVAYQFIDNYDHSWKLWRLEIISFFKYIKNLD